MLDFLNFQLSDSKIFDEPISEPEPSELAKPITRQPSKDTIFMSLNEFIKFILTKLGCQAPSADRKV
jgi:hypothetical protein